MEDIQKLYCGKATDFGLLCTCKTLKVDDECTAHDFEWDSKNNWCFDSKNDLVCKKLVKDHYFWENTKTY